MTGVTITPLASFRNERPYPFCPGCGHGSILDALDRALAARNADPARVVIVSDIGCSGLSDQYFATSAFHGLHGRSITYATGIKLARPDLDVVVVMGDGGTGIGGAHLLSAARRNIGITVLIFNNLNFGMTGGQHSTTTPPGAVTATTPEGNLERPLDIVGTVGVNGAQYAWRGTSFDGDLPERIAEGMDSGGFALLDVWELCTAYYVRSNAFSRRAIDATIAELGFETGLLFRRDHPEYASAIRARRAPRPATPEPIVPEFDSSLDRRLGIVAAGAAGGRVRSATRTLAHAAVLGGLWVAQRDDYPITVKTGHSLSMLAVGPGPIRYAAIPVPDVVVVAAPEGLAKAGPLLAGMAPDGLVVTTPELSPDTPAGVVVVDPARSAMRIPKADLALALLTVAAARTGVVSIEALRRAAGAGDPRFAAKTVETIDAAASLAG
jgi:pyruvate/2-oxoacid:ferredoxin oxidoreductase beta subunit/Pyruvate/2-oxoacid:ferredoxin oxidoreductase gamma subunit